MKRFIGTVLTFIIIIGVLEGCSNIRNAFPNGENKTNGITPTPTITCDMVPYDAQLEIICSEGKLLFSRIATTPRVRAGRPPFDITCVWNYEYEPEIISTLFQVILHMARLELSRRTGIATGTICDWKKGMNIKGNKLSLSLL